jgi:long-chain acyl-CoA synthetase
MAKESLGDRIWYKNWPPQVPKCLDYPDCTLAEFLKQSAAKHGSQAAIYFLDAEVTYDQLWDMVQRLATALADLGLKKGDVCALMLPNSIQFVASFYACQLIGVTVTAINPTYKALEIQHQLKDSGAKVLIVLDAVASEVREGIERNAGQNGDRNQRGGPLRVFPSQGPSGQTPQENPYGRTPGRGPPTEKSFEDQAQSAQGDVDPSDVAVLQYTGGTTGLAQRRHAHP